MVKEKWESTRTCDICGKEITIPRFDCYHDKCLDNWVHIQVSRLVYDGNDYSDTISHGIDLCPDCYKSILHFLKENCDNASTWPKDL